MEEEKGERKKVDISSLGGILKRIGNYDMSSLQDRIIFQKTVYLLQAFGLYLGYKFSWYIYGPYSTQLTRDGFELIEIYDKVPEMRFAKEENEKVFLKFFLFLGGRKNDSNWLEVLASIHFLKELYPKESKERIINKVIDKQPYFNKEICEEAWSYLELFGLI